MNKTPTKAELAAEIETLRASLEESRSNNDQYRGKIYSKNQELEKATKDLENLSRLSESHAESLILLRQLIRAFAITKFGVDLFSFDPPDETNSEDLRMLKHLYIVANGAHEPSQFRSMRPF